MSAKAQRALLLSTVAMIAALTMANSPAVAQAQPTTEELLKHIKLLEERMRSLEAQVQKQQVQKQQAQQQPAPRQQAAPAQATAATAPTTVKPAQAVGQPTQPAPAPGGAVASAMSSPASPEGGKPPNKDLFGIAPSPIDGLKIGMYGELKYGAQMNPNPPNVGQWQTGFDAARLVLLPSYKFTDSIIFNAEIEFEHAGSGFDNDDKLHGTAEVEQAYIDFLVAREFNVRSPGIDLVPIGFINQHHEPTQFYSVDRPELDNGKGNGLVPTTWASPAASVYGRIIDGLDYQFQVSTSLEDFGDSFDNRTDGNTVTPGPYIAGIDGFNGLNASTPPRGGYRQLTSELGYALRLAYEPAFIPGFAGSTSVYFSPNIVPRGAHDTNNNPLGTSSLALFDSEFRYRPPQTGWEFRGEGVLISFGNPAALRANNDGDPTNNVGSTMWGVSGEVAYHFQLGRALGGDWEAVPFYRYTYMDKQTGGYAGTDLNLPTGAGQQHYHTVGLALFPTPELVLKFTYQKVLDASATGALSDSILGAVGFHF
jgi:hypothetical protein